MRRKTYRVHLTKDEKKRLEGIVSKGVHPARQVRRARILLLLNEGEGPEGEPVEVPEQSEIARQCQCNTAVVYTVSTQYVKEGLERVLNRKRRESPPVAAKVTGEIEAQIIALSCSEPPEGRRYVSACRPRTKKDWAREVTSIVTEEYPQADKVVLVMDNLNTTPCIERT